MNVLKLSEAVSLGLHIMASLAAREGERLSLRELVEPLPISSAHSAKVMQRLARAGLVDSQRGPKGGFVLARSPARITLMDVQVAIEGPPKDTPCLLGKPACGRSSCIMGDLLGRLSHQFLGYMEKTSLADIVESDKGD